MKLSDRKEMIREVFTDLELSEVRAALSDRYNTLTKMAKKEEEHGRRYDDRSWPRERLAILDGDGMRAGVIDVFNPKSADAKNGELFEDDEEEDLEEVSVSSMVNRPNAFDEPAAPQYENTPDICPHTEILDLSKGDETPRFKCTLCGEEIRALGAPAGDGGDAETVEADYEIVDEDEPAPEYVHSLLRGVFPDEDPLPSAEAISGWPIADRRAVVKYATAVHLGGTDFMTGDIPSMPEVLKPYLAPEELHAAAEGPTPPTLEELDALTLEVLGVPTRARNVLARRGIKTAADYLAAGDAVLRMPRVGDITLNEINQALRDRGLTEQAAREIEAQLVAQGRAFVGAMGGGETEEVEAEPAGTLYDRVLSVPCPTCSASNGVGAGEVCVTVGGNPRSSFHAVRVRAAVQAGAITPDEYDAAYGLSTVEDDQGEVDNVQPSEDTLPWEQVGLALGNGKPAEPEEIIVLDAMEWPEGPPEPGQQVRDLRPGSDRQLVIGAVDNRFVALAHPETGRPVGSLRVADVRWSPTLGCWAWGAPAAAGV